MTDVELKLNAWTDNPGTSVFAVQGEQESRTLHVTLIDRTGVNSDVMSVAKVTPRYIDLTGYTARLYVVKSDSTKVYFPGEITDAENGKVDFTLTGQCVAAPGKAKCTIVLTKEDVELKVVGIVLDVHENDLEGSIESSDEWVELDVMLTKAQEAIDACETATDAANSAATSATSKITEMDQLKGDLETAEAARVTAEQGRESAESARQSAEQQRQTDTASAISACNTAAGAANTAADRANKAAEAIEGTDVGDLAVRVHDLEGEMDTVNGKIDGLNVPQMQQSITQLQNGKVDKEDGKGLSSNDYTDTDKAKVNALPAYMWEERPIDLDQITGMAYFEITDNRCHVMIDITHLGDLSLPGKTILSDIPVPAVPPEMPYIISGEFAFGNLVVVPWQVLLMSNSSDMILVTGEVSGEDNIGGLLTMHIDFAYPI